MPTNDVPKPSMLIGQPDRRLIMYRGILACKAPLLIMELEAAIHSPVYDSHTEALRKAEEDLRAFTVQSADLNNKAKEKTWVATTSRRRALRDSRGRVNRYPNK